MAETSLSWIPASSWYCNQRSDSIISAAASQRRIAASPRVIRPSPSSATADGTFEKIAAPAVTAAPAIALFLRKERRSNAFVDGEATSSPGVWFEFDRVSRGRLLFFITNHFLC